jgi:hypothetical protein
VSFVHLQINLSSSELNIGRLDPYLNILPKSWEAQGPGNVSNLVAAYQRLAHHAALSEASQNECNKVRRHVMKRPPIDPLIVPNETVNF